MALSPAQAVSISLALELLPPDSPFAVDARAAVAKVVDTLGPRARERADSLSGRVWVMPDGERPARPAVVRAIERSIVEQRVLTITYRSAESDTTRRTVEPVLAAWANGRWYLVAHCRLRGDLRWFRFGRIQRADLGGEQYEPRPVSDVGAPPEGARPVGGR